MVPKKTGLAQTLDSTTSTEDAMPEPIKVVSEALGAVNG